jgi:hypothetical protein
MNALVRRADELEPMRSSTVKAVERGLVGEEGLGC